MFNWLGIALLLAFNLVAWIIVSHHYSIINSVYPSTEEDCKQMAQKFMRDTQSTDSPFYDVAYPLDYSLLYASLTDSKHNCYATVEWTDYSRESGDSYHAFVLYDVQSRKTILATGWKRRCEYLSKIDCGKLPPRDRDDGVSGFGPKIDVFSFYDERDILLRR